VLVVARDIYISDADVEMSRDVESLRIERHLEADLASHVPGRKRKIIDRLEEHGRQNPLAIVPVLARHYNHEDPKVRSQIRASLARLTQSEVGELALVECIFSRDTNIANTAAGLLEERNFGSMNFLSSYRHTRNLVFQARKVDVFCQDVEELIVDSIETYKEGRFDQAMTNMSMAKDLLEDRLEWHGHLRGYIKDVLKLTPTLSRSGVQIDPIQDSLRNLSTAVEQREYSDARSLLDLRRQETRIWKQLWSLEEYLTKRIKVKPITELMVLKDSDKKVLDSFVAMARAANGEFQDGKPSDALKIVEDFVRDQVSAEYLAREGKRLDTKDEAAWFVMWSIGLGLLKVVSTIIPNVAEEFYQKYFRDREGSSSIFSVAWPEPFASIESEQQAPEKTSKKSRSPTKKS
jgi:hypothetical protein